MPTRGELIAANRDEAQICREIGADGLIYQDLADLKAAVRAVNPSISFFETSCFDGCYVTGDITTEYLSGIETLRGAGNLGFEDEDDGQLDLNLVANHDN